MSVIFATCQQVQGALGSDECSLICNVNLTNVASRKTIHIPVVMVTNSTVVAFMGFDSSIKLSSEQLGREFRNVTNALLENLDIGFNNLLMCGYIDSEVEIETSSFCIFNIYNDKLLYFSYTDDFIQTLLNDLSYSRYPFGKEHAELLCLKLKFMSGIDGSVMSDSEGHMYVKKRGRWFLASEWDPDELFQKAAFGGMFGIHKFADHKKLIGLLYFLTCGFFGIVWLFDCVEMLFGNYRDSDGKYVLPVSNRKSCVLKIFGGAAILLFYMFIYLISFKLLGGWVNNLTENFVASQIATTSVPIN